MSRQRGAQLGSPDTPGLALFRRICSQCHVLPDPALHKAEEWPAVVDRMRTNMEAMGKGVITDRERDEITGYLAKVAGS
jgi:mono/diheme cytochrome c family protein